MKILVLSVLALIFMSIDTFAATEDVAWSMGGFKSAESNGTTITIKCGTNKDKHCYGVNGSGQTIFGDPVKLWSNTNNENIGSETNGVGYINAIFRGYVTPGIPESGIKFDITPQTITVYTYSQWLNYLTY